MLNTYIIILGGGIASLLSLVSTVVAIFLKSRKKDNSIRKEQSIANQNVQTTKSASSYECIFCHESENHEKAESCVGNAMLTLFKCGNIGEIPLQFERLFRKYMGYWYKESVDTTRAALVSLALLKDKRYIGQKDNFIRFVNSCFDKRKGGYCIVPNDTVKASIYATSNATEVLKSALGKGKKEKLINNGSIDELKPEEIKLIEGFIGRCIKTTDRMNRIYDDEFNSIDEISVIYLARRLFWSLNKECEFFNLFSRQDIENYIRSCAREMGGFASNPSQKEPGMSTTYFALSLAIDGFCELEQAEKSKEFFGQRKDKIYNFIEGCWDDQVRGYSASRGILPSLNGTFFALRNLKLLGYEITPERKSKIRYFIESCYCNDGGFAFSNSISPKEPSAHATRWALQISEYLEDENILTEIQKEETKKFLYNLYDSDKGGFSGFYIPSKVKFFLEKCPLAKYTNQHYKS